MKKLFALILAGAMAISMVACSSKGSDNSGDTDSEGKLKVQLIVSNLGDKSFNDSADASLKEMQSEGQKYFYAMFEDCKDTLSKC